jgi:O-antigen ligase
MYRSGVQMVQDNPLLGVGPGMVERRYPVYRADDAPRWRVPHLHSNLLQISAERGLIGTAAYLSILVVFFAHTWRRLRRPAQEHFAPLAGCFLAVAGITVAGLFEYSWGDAEVWILTLAVMAVPFALDGEEAPA